MGVKIIVKDLGELVNRSYYSHTFTKDQEILGMSVIDDNNHVNNIGYVAVIEKIRQLEFLPRYGFSDKKLNEIGWKQIRKIGAAEFGTGLMEGEQTDIHVSVYIEPKLWFHMLFDFYNSQEKLAAKIVTNDFWMKNEKGVWVVHRGFTPQFFINAIRNV